jgi:hypothetical protein
MDSTKWTCIILGVFIFAATIYVAVDEGFIHQRLGLASKGGEGSIYFVGHQAIFGGFCALFIGGGMLWALWRKFNGDD